jgi:hypothetical protein
MGGREGDMLNLIFAAKEDDLQLAFARASWLKWKNPNLKSFGICCGRDSTTRNYQWTSFTFLAGLRTIRSSCLTRGQ